MSKAMAALSDEDRANLTAYLDGELDEAAAQALEAKLSQNPAARAEADALRQAWGLLDYLPRAEPSPSFTHRTLEKLSLEMQPGSRSGSSSASQLPAKAPRRWRLVLGTAAALLLATAGSFGLGRWLHPHGTQPAPDPDEMLIRRLRVVEKWRWYEPIEDRVFLNALDTPELFGDDPG